MPRLAEEPIQARSFEALANQLTVALFVIDSQQRCAYLNPAAEALTGYALSDLRERSLHEALHGIGTPGAVCPTHDCAFDRALRANERMLGEASLMHRQGNPLPVAYVASPIREQAGEVGTLLEVESIAERRRAEAEVGERARLAAFQADVSVALTEPGALRETLQHCAEAMVRHLDAAFARIWTLNVAEPVLELQASAGMYTHLNGAHGRVPVGQLKIGLIAEERQPHLTNQVLGDPRVGDQQWARDEGMVAFAGYPLIIDGEVVGVMALFARHPLSELTLEGMASVANALSLGIQRARAEEQRAALLERAERERARLRELFEQAPASIAVVSGPEHTFALANRGYRQLVGNRDVLGQCIREALPELSGQALLELLDSVYASGEAYVGNEQPVMLDRTGAGALEEGYFNFVYQPVRGDTGQVQGIFVHAVEVSDQVLARRRVENLAEQLAAANRELEAFSYSVSHDLRAPLRAMDGFSRILLDEYADALPEQAQRYLGMVRDGARQMGQLVDDLLAFSRLNRQELARRMVDPATLARQAASEVQSLESERDIQLLIAEMPLAWADSNLLRQVYANMLSNAFKFSRVRSPAVVEVGARQIDGENVYFVKDNGVGFDQRYADKLFGVFQRLHRAEEYEGTGVGTAIVQRIIHRHGGRVWAEAEVDQGATFYFTLGGSA